MRSVHTAEYQRLLRRLGAARRKAGLTQVAAAKALRQTQAYVSKCESGERRIDAVELRAFAELYDTSVGKLLGEPGC